MNFRRYATPSPAAFDIANHFAEWGGLQCDYNAMPSQAQRRAFLKEYIQSHRHHTSLVGTNHATSRAPNNAEGEVDDALVEQLFEEVNLFRGVPGFCWLVVYPGYPCQLHFKSI